MFSLNSYMPSEIYYKALEELEKSILHKTDRFSHLIVNGTVTDEWQYVRDISPDNTSKPIPVVPPYLKIIPQYPPDMFHPNIRCGRDAWMARPNNTERLTHTADVIAGSEVGFRVGVNVVSSFQLPIYFERPDPRSVVISGITHRLPCKGLHQTYDLPRRSRTSVPSTSAR